MLLNIFRISFRDQQKINIYDRNVLVDADVKNGQKMRE